MGRSALVAFGLALTFLFPVSCGSTTSTNDPIEPECGRVAIETRDVVPPPPDGVAACPAGKCNYQAATGCGPGLACRPYFTADAPDVNPGCELAGDGVVGSVCKSGADCASGFFCAEGVCRKQCCGGDWSACDSGESCIRQVEVRAGGKVIDSGLSLCFPVDYCDPLDTAPCKDAPNRECKIVDPTGAVACEPLSNAKLGDDCVAGTVCAAGLTCVLDSCRRLCRAETCGEPACPVEEGTCVHFNRDPEGVGECTPNY